MFEDEASYTRRRLLHLHQLNRIIYPKKIWEKMEKCILQKTTPEEIGRRLQQILPETMTEEFAQELRERLTAEHGAWRYEGRPKVLWEDVENASVKYRFFTIRDEIYTDCGHTLQNSRDERLDDAVFYSVKETDR